MANWDSEIDDVAREMTEGGPDEGFEARVLVRIDAVDRRGWRLPPVRAWSPAAAAAALVLALVVVRQPWKTATGRLKPDIGSATGASGAIVQPPSDATISNQSRPRLPDAAVTRNAAASSGTNQEASRIGADVVAGRTAPRVTNRAAREATAETAGTLTGTARADPFGPPPLEVFPLDVEAIEAMDSIDVPAFAVPALAAPAAAIAELEVPAIGAQ